MTVHDLLLVESAESRTFPISIYHTAFCRCGWRSEAQVTGADARREHAAHCRRRAMSEENRRVVVAVVSTRSFEFIAVGADRDEAKAALLALWDRHCADYRDADPGLMREIVRDEEVTFLDLPFGGGARDGEPL